MLEAIASASAAGSFEELPQKAIQCLAALLVLESNNMELVGTQDEQDTMDIINGVASMAPPRHQKETINTFNALNFFYKTRTEMVETSSSKFDSLLLTIEVPPEVGGPAHRVRREDQVG